METFLSQSAQQGASIDSGWWFGFFGLVVGIVSFAYVVISDRDRKKKELSFEDDNKEMLNELRRTRRGRITAEQLRHLEAQRESLLAEVSRKVPQLAQIVFLKHRRATLASSIAELYQQYNTATEELSKLNTTQQQDPNLNEVGENAALEELNPALRIVVEHEIMPLYLDQQRQQQRLYRLLLLLILSTLTIPFGSRIITDTLYQIEQALGIRVFPEELLSYIGGFAFAVFILFSLPLNRIRVNRAIKAQSRMGLFTIGLTLFLTLFLWAILSWLLVFNPEPLQPSVFNHTDWTTPAGIASLLLLAGSLRFLDLVFSRRVAILTFIFLMCGALFVILLRALFEIIA